MSTERRRKKALDVASSLSFEGLVATRAFNIYYLTGFWGAGIFLMKQDKAELLVSKLEYDRAKASSDVEVLAYQPSELADLIASFFGSARVAIDRAEASLYSSIKQKVNVETSDVLERAREVKFEDELDAIKGGGRIMDAVYERALESVRDGMRERELYAIIVKEIIENGGDVIAYEDTIGTEIVAFGENTSYPHYSPPSDRQLRAGDPILLDLTLRFNGYVVDFTRTFFFRRVDERIRETYEKVKEAQELGIRLLKNGAKAKEIDLAVREFFGAERDLFNHSLGHGVGLEVHEKPYISYRSEDVISNDQALTIEPGLYYAGKFGIRIEDTLIMKDTPVKIFRSPTELLIV
ncbi:MAG: M24 family metallopeptidase [Nitrososphaeria archaeon]